MSTDLLTVSNILQRARTKLQGCRSPIYYSIGEATAWRAGFKFCVETFVQAALAETRELVHSEQMREDRAAAADPSYDRIDHLIYREEEYGLSPGERRELREDHKRLRAAEKALRRPKVDPNQEVVLFHGERTGKLTAITQVEQEVNTLGEQ